ncbi:MAG: hypothetical protein ACR2FV_03005 [Ornithinimicrobium sp.]|uniref:hypothetical protein n=1 Tax=Ornithinimicrobium sp. TaxID=1977084 RepID=UPI003D9B0830
MITTTHIVTHALIAWGRRPRRLLGTRATRRAFIAGGLAPDLGLALMSAGAFACYPLVRGQSLPTTFALVYDELFYTSPVWIAAHNVLHAPLVIAALYLLGRRTRRRWSAGLRAFAGGCALHTLMDIVVHHDDGPLLLFPLEWTVRFSSPLSYWDPAHHGDVIGPIDLAITVVGSAVLLIGHLLNRRGRRPPPAGVV